MLGTTWLRFSRVSLSGTRRTLDLQLADRRGRRIVFVSHCLLNENVRYLGGATRPGVVQEAIDHYTGGGIALYQMPCPEQRAWGGVRKSRMMRLYGSRALRWRFLRHVFVTGINWWSMPVYRRLARRVAADIADYVGSGFDVVEIVGVGASPSCGVSTTLDLNCALEAMARCDPSAIHRSIVNQRVVAPNVVEGQGMFIAALRHQLRRRGLDVRFLEHDLVGELRSAGELAPDAWRQDAPGP